MTEQGIPMFATNFKNDSSMDKNVITESHIRFGMAHGVAGLLSFISICLMNGYDCVNLENSIKSLIKFFDEYSFYKKSVGVVWPAKLPIPNFIKHSITLDNSIPFSWCYGTAGICSALYNAGRALNNKEVCDKAIDMLVSNVYKNDVNLMFISPILCHGYSGLLLVLTYLYNISHDENLIECLISMRKKINDYSKLNGGFMLLSLENERIVMRNDMKTVLNSDISVYIALRSLTIENDFLKQYLLIE